MPKRTKFVENKYFTALRSETASRGEHNDCTVKALAVAARIPYSEAHEALRRRGRRNRKGFYTYEIVKELDERGFTVKKINIERFMSEWYPRSLKHLQNITLRHFVKFPSIFGEYRFLAKVKGHVAMYDGGNGLVDWSVNSSKRVTDLYMVLDVGDV